MTASVIEVSGDSAAPTFTGKAGAVGPFRRTTLILLALLLVHVGWVVWKSATNMPTIDFLTFWSVPHYLSRHPITNVYSPEAQREMASLTFAEAESPNATNLQRQATAKIDQLYNGRIDSTGTPFLYTLVASLSSGDFSTDQKRFVLLCTLSLILSLLILNGVLRFSVVEASLLIIFITSYYAPVLVDMQVGNVNEFQLLGIAIFIFFMVRGWPLLAGLAIGAATMLKPTPILVLVVAIVAALADRQYRPLFRMLAGCLLAAGTCFFVSAAYFRNPLIWLYFVQSLPKTLSGVSYSLENGNFSLPMLLLGPTRPGSFVILLSLLAVLFWILFATRPAESAQASKLLSDEVDERRRMHTTFAAAGGGCAIMLLSSPLVWPHYFLLLLPLSLYLMRPSSEEGETFSPGRAPLKSIGRMALPFVPFLMFSFLTEVMVSNSALKTCILFLVGTVLTSSLAFYRVWQQRTVLNLPNSAVADPVISGEAAAAPQSARL